MQNEILRPAQFQNWQFKFCWSKCIIHKNFIFLIQNNEILNDFLIPHNDKIFLHNAEIKIQLFRNNFWHKAEKKIKMFLHCDKKHCHTQKHLFISAVFDLKRRTDLLMRNFKLSLCSISMLFFIMQNIVLTLALS